MSGRLAKPLTEGYPPRSNAADGWACSGGSGPRRRLEAGCPSPDGIGRDGDHLGDLLGLVPQVQQPDRNCSLPHFGMNGVIDGLLDLSKLFRRKREVDSSVQAFESISFVDSFRLPA